MLSIRDLHVCLHTKSACTQPYHPCYAGCAPGLINIVLLSKTSNNVATTCTTLMILISTSLIQDWIYRQLLTLSEPLHPTLPPLLQEFVNSILLSAITPGPRGTGGYNTAANKSHAPFTDEEVRISFQSYSCGSTYQISTLIYEI